MANSLINGTEGGMVSAPLAEPDPTAGKVPTWGYSAADAKIFYLDEGAKLPDGYYYSPADIPVVTPKKPKPALKAADDDSA